MGKPKGKHARGNGNGKDNNKYTKDKTKFKKDGYEDKPVFGGVRVIRLLSSSQPFKDYTKQ